MKKILPCTIFLSVSLCCCFYIQDKQIQQSILTVPRVDEGAANSTFLSMERKDAWPIETWWEEFSDPTLSHLITLALSKNPSLLSLQAKVEQAKQQAVISRSKLFPYLFFNYNESWEYLSSNGLYKALNPSIASSGNLIDLSLSFSYELDFWSKNRNMLRASLGAMQADIAELEEAKLLTATALAQGFFAFRAQDSKQKILEKMIAIGEKILFLKEGLVEHALVDLTNPLLFAERVEEYKKMLAATLEQKEVSLHLICSLSGQGPNDVAMPEYAILEPLPCRLALPSNISLELLGRRPDLLAQLWRVKALAYEVGAAKAAFFPNINLAALAGLESLSFSTLFEAASKTFALEPAITLPLFTAGAIRAGVRAKVAAFDSAVFLYNEKILQSCKEIADTVSLCHQVSKSFSYQQKIVSDASTIFSLTSMRQSSGLDSNIEKWLKELAMLDKDLALIDVIFSQYLCSLKLIRSLGGGFYSSALDTITKAGCCER